MYANRSLLLLACTMLTLSYLLISCDRPGQPGRTGHTGPTVRRVDSVRIVTIYRPQYSEYRFPAPNTLLLRAPRIPLSKYREITHGDRTSPKIALTFDACSTLRPSRFDSTLGVILRREGIPVTIFFGGKWILDRPDDARQLSALPYVEVGNHSYLHGHLTRVSAERMEREIRWTQDIIFTVTGKLARVFRPPYIESNAAVVKLAADLGLHTIIGDLPSGDPDPGFSSSILENHVSVNCLNGSIIIMHINKGGIHTAEALPGIIEKLKKRGFQFSTVSGML